MTPRAQMITQHLKLDGLGVEYGPLHQTLLPKPQHNVLYVDYADRDFLVPDLLGWLESNLRLLKVGGRIAIAFPDKRYCFDIKRRPTILSDILCAYLEKRTRPTFQQICDHFWNVSRVTAVSAWDGTITASNAEYIHSRDRALSVIKSK